MSGRRPAASARSNAARNKKKDEKKGGWVGCLVLVAVFALPVLVPLGWGLWSEGAFDEDLSGKAVPALTSGDTARLAADLGEASRRQRICFGWEVDAGTAAALEIGSNLGVGVDARKDPASCPKYMVLRADYLYFGKEWSSVSLNLEENLDGPSIPFTRVNSLMRTSDLGDDAVADLANAIGALPLLAAEFGFAQPLGSSPLEPQPFDGQELGSLHGPGWYFTLGLGGLLVAGGLFWIIWGAVRAARKTGT